MHLVRKEINLSDYKRKHNWWANFGTCFSKSSWTLYGLHTFIYWLYCIDTQGSPDSLFQTSKPPFVKLLRNQTQTYISNSNNFVYSNTLNFFLFHSSFICGCWEERRGKTQRTEGFRYKNKFKSRMGSLQLAKTLLINKKYNTNEKKNCHAYSNSNIGKDSN